MRVNYRRVFLLVLLAFGSLTLPGCRSLGEFEVYTNDTTEITRFDGIRAVANSDDVQLVFIHGMGDYADGDPARMIDHVVQELSLVEAGRSQSNVKYEERYVGEIKTIDYSHKKSDRRVRVRIVDWRLSTQNLKANAFERDNDVFEARRTRLERHGSLKQWQNFMLGDVFLYGNKELRPAMQQPLRVALDDLAKDLESGTPLREPRTIVISFSLGAKMLADVLLPSVHDDTQSTSNRIVRSIERVFLLSNQLSLLGLTNDAVAFQDMFKNATFTDRDQFALVAITDPNDHLSYRIEDSLFESSIGDYIIDIDVSIATRAYWIPFLGWIVRPTKAHTGYGASSTALKLLTDGYQK